MKKFMIIVGIIQLLFVQTVRSDMADELSAFSSLLTRSELVVRGSVTEVIADANNYRVSLLIHECLLGSASGTIEIITPLADGFRLPDEAYPELRNSYVLFLKNIKPGWRIVNYYSGLFPGELTDDIDDVIDEWSGNKRMFSDDATSLKKIYRKIKSDHIKQLLQIDLETSLSANDSEFIHELLDSGTNSEKALAIRQIGKRKMGAMKNRVKVFLSTSHDPEILYNSLIALGDDPNETDIVLIEPFLTHERQEIRRVAIQALGNIHSTDIQDPLSHAYENETDVGNRVAIIDAISRMDDLGSVRTTLIKFKSIEKNSIVLQYVNIRLNQI
jgi:hypothetical protein